MSDTQEAHDLFRGAGEVSKWIRVVALAGELVAAAIALCAILKQVDEDATWRPVAAFTLAWITWAFREYAAHVDRFSEQCRRVSARAYASGAIVPRNVCATFLGDAPPLAKSLSKRLPAVSLEAYYEPSTGPGEARLREMYAHGAFYTWRLLRWTAWLYGVPSAGIFFAAALVVYQLAAADSVPVSREPVLEALFSVVLGILGLRGLSVTVASAFSARAARKTADALIATPLPAGRALDGLADAYDFERVGAPSPPTIIYKLMRKRLSREWNYRKEALWSSCAT